LSIPDYPWKTLASPIIDIGGGIGSFEAMLLSIAKNKKLSFTIFDIEKTVEHAKTVSQPASFRDRLLYVRLLLRHGPVNLNGCKNMYPLLQEISSPSDSKIPTAVQGAGTYVIRHVHCA
jgi:hypothetical protein